MAFFRRRGNQLVLVQGYREPGSKRVYHQELFALSSKAEARAAMGTPDASGGLSFAALLESEYPGIDFDWSRIRTGIEDNLDHLPDESASNQKAQPGTQFSNALTTFTRHLLLSDPTALTPPGDSVLQYRAQLEFLQALLTMRTGLAEQAPGGAWTSRNEFYWRRALRGPEVPVEAEQLAVNLFKQGDLDRAEAAFQLLVDTFENYANGHNFLGLIADKRGDLEGALADFETSAAVGRGAFPPRFPKSRYWADSRTRPFVRGLRNRTMVLLRLGRHEEALGVCDEMEQEWGKDRDARSLRAMTFLLAGRWEESVSQASGLDEVHPTERFVLALALYEVGDHGEAMQWFVHGALAQPGAARSVLGIACKPSSVPELAQNQRNGEKVLSYLEPYLTGEGQAARTFFKKLIQLPPISEKLDQVDALVERSAQAASSEESPGVDALEAMHTPEFAGDLVVSLADWIDEDAMS